MKHLINRLHDALTLIVRCLLFTGRTAISTLTRTRSGIMKTFDRLVDTRVQHKIRELEEQIRFLKAGQESESKKACVRGTMDACSRFAGGVAHDLNNILSGFITLPEMLLMDLPKDSPLVKPLQTVMRTGARASNVVSDMVAMSRGITGSRSILNLNTVITRFMKSETYTRIQTDHPDLMVQSDLSPGLLNILGSTDHMDSLLKHLLNHIIAAMAGEGSILIKTENTYVDAPPENITDMPAGEYVCLSCSHNGFSIPREHLDHMFEPYYCRKVLKRSCSGMGLSIVWNMVSSSNGFISIQSGEDGPVCDLFFPASRKESHSSDQPESVPSDHLLGTGESVLVIDDDELQREIASDILARSGYQVQTVSSGERAIEHLKTKKADILILDMIMPPGINGYETYKRILQFTPHQKAVIASGFVLSADVEKVQTLGAGPYIRKPYLVNDLLQAVRKELDRKD